VKSSVVTISINKGDYTITSSKFTFYYNTAASECIAYGPGLLNENCPEVETIFCI
jgi:dynein heavy chain